MDGPSRQQFAGEWLTPTRLARGVAVCWALTIALPVAGDDRTVSLSSPDGRNEIEFQIRDGRPLYRIVRDRQTLISRSNLGLHLRSMRLDRQNSVAFARRREIDEAFELLWGKTRRVANRCRELTVGLDTASGVRWEVVLRAYDDGVAFRYRLPRQEQLDSFVVAAEATSFNPRDNPQAMYNALGGFESSHESLYSRTAADEAPVGELLDCPLLLLWPDGPAAAITEARVREFAGMYLQRPSPADARLRCILAPLPGRRDVAVAAAAPLVSPWRVVLLADRPGKLLESNLLLCLNESPQGDFRWAAPGKTTFHWWCGEFEDDHQHGAERDVYVARHQRYIDFCAENNIAYHYISGDGFAWYVQSPTNYGEPAADADICTPRPELGFPEILDYARRQGVGIRLWVHWKPLSERLDEALRTYQSWGVEGLMVDFLDRDDQQMLEFVDRLLTQAARRELSIQIHGSSKFSGEQRTFPHLFNREGVLNLEYNKWSKLCTPGHAVNVAYTRALARPVDFHLGGLRSVPRADFKPRDRRPHVTGTRCHHLALYVVYENPMPMVADCPDVYAGLTGFEFIREVPTTWDETRFVAGEAGEFIVLARRSGRTWYVGGITNWTARRVVIDCDFLGAGTYEARCFVDGSLDESSPRAVRTRIEPTSNDASLIVEMAPGGGFAAIVSPK